MPGFPPRRASTRTTEAFLPGRGWTKRILFGSTSRSERDARSSAVLPARKTTYILPRCFSRYRAADATSPGEHQIPCRAARSARDALGLPRPGSP